MIQSVLFNDREAEKDAVTLAAEAEEAVIREMAKMILAIYRTERKSTTDTNNAKEREHNV